MITLLLAALLALQDPAAKPVQPEWREYDGIALIINEETTTVRGFETQLRRMIAITPSADRNRAREYLIEQIKNDALGSQAGAAMDIDPNMIKRTVRDYEKRVIESRGGVDKYNAYLASIGQTAEGMRIELGKQVLRDIWEASRIGKGPNQQQKVIADRFIRPGTLRLTYQQFIGDPRAITIIGGSSGQVVLQILEIDTVKVGGTGMVEENAKKIRERIASGQSDFEQEAQFAITDSPTGARDPIVEAGLPETFPQLARLVANAKEGDVLPPIPPSGNKQEWSIVRVLKRIPGTTPGFKDTGVQKTIRERFEDVLDSRRLKLARDQQLASSYVWPPRPAAAK
jgi:hypothetical protein